ncbi:MAG: hypothetical protein GY929_04835 [Actinomycetia bacterium]|nr:hypothetical protein [Actinomycetes bacterium]
MSRPASDKNGRSTPKGGRVTPAGTRPNGRPQGGTALRRRSPVAYWVAVFAAAALVFGTLATLLSVII